MRKVEVMPYNRQWVSLFTEEADKLCRIFGSEVIEIHHIGSTSVPGLNAKPIIDIMPVVRDINRVDEFNTAMIVSGYEPKGENGISGRRNFQKGGDNRTHHVHIYESGNPEIERHLAFRDYLRAHPEVAKTYGDLKSKLMEQFPYDIESYIKGKEQLVLEIDRKAAVWYRNSQEQMPEGYRESLSQIVEIEDYNPQWESEFLKIRGVIESVIGQLILSIKHVGSTSVKGLGAKPILDIDVVIEDYSVLPAVIHGLEKIGYFHQENWSFEGREAFGRKDTFVPWDGKTNWMEHHLYVCTKDSKELARHLAFRDYLRNHPEAAEEYEQIKKALAKVVKDRTEYSQGKSEFVKKILEKAMKQIL